MRLDFRKIISLLVLPVTGIGVTLGVWHLLSISVGPQRFPPLRQIYDKLIFFAAMKQYAQKNILEHIGFSLLRISLGLSIAISGGIIFSIVTYVREVDLTIGTIYKVLRCIPPIAWIPLSILWFGLGEMSKAFIIFWGAFAPVYINTSIGLTTTPHDLVDLGKLFSLKDWQIFMYIRLPAALPYIFTGIKISLGAAWMCLVAAEMVAALEGLGYLVVASMQTLDLSLCITAMILMGIVSLMLISIVELIERRICHWALLK